MNRRRSFLQGGGLAALGVLAGCGPGGRWPLGVARGIAPFSAPEAGGIDLVQHVLLRCTFGPRPGDREALLALAPTAGAAVDAWLERQLAPASIDDPAGERVARRWESLQAPAGELFEYKKPVLLRDLATASLLRAVRSERALLEVMVELWTDHFNIDISKGDCAWLKAADDREVVRRHALGRFPDLLRASALSPAMLTYLDGRENRVSGEGERPNENYARELLELHTLGVHGGYAQGDVMEVARCLTGFTVRSRSDWRKGAVEFRAEHHDDGEKTVLGHRVPAGGGRGDLDRVLAIVAHHPSTARHVAAKLCRRFLAEEPPAAAVTAVAEAFLATGGDIPACLRALFRRPEFRAEEGGLRALRGARLKRPFHYVVSALRATAAETDGGPQLQDSLQAMGQALFQCPTPDGYSAEAAPWVGTLLARWRFASDLARDGLAGTRVDLDALAGAAGGGLRLLAHLVGRRPAPREESAWVAAGGGRHALALLLASPAFQRF